MFIQYSGYLSGLLMFLAFLPYIRDILKKKTKPERASWFIWAMLGFIAFFSQLAKGASYSLYMTGVQAAGDLFIFILAIKYGLGGFEKRDRIALIFVVLSLVLWLFTREAIVALIMVILIDGTGGVLTIIKSYREPATETLSAWVFNTFSGLFACVAVGSLNPALLAFPIYIVVINFAIFMSIMFSRRKSILETVKS